MPHCEKYTSLAVRNFINFNLVKQTIEFIIFLFFLIHILEMYALETVRIMFIFWLFLRNLIEGDCCSGWDFPTNDPKGGIPCNLKLLWFDYYIKNIHFEKKKFLQFLCFPWINILLQSPEKVFKALILFWICELFKVWCVLSKTISSLQDKSLLWLCERTIETPTHCDPNYPSFSFFNLFE